MASVSFNKEGKAKCLFTNKINGSHEWAWQSRKKEYHCTNGNCKGVKKAAPPKGEGEITVTSMGLLARMRGKPENIKGSKWGNRGDKALMEQQKQQGRRR